MLECVTNEFIKISPPTSESTTPKGIMFCLLQLLNKLIYITDKEPYKAPQPHAVRFVTVLCQASRKICESVAASDLLTFVATFVEAGMFMQSYYL